MRRRNRAEGVSNRHAIGEVTLLALGRGTRVRFDSRGCGPYITDRSVSC